MALTIERLKELINYDPETGIMKWTAASKSRADKIAGCIRKDGYIVVRIDGVLLYGHRLAWFYVNGEWPSIHIDHKNGLTGDNRISNLRDVPPSINMQNRRSAARSNEASGLLGVQRNHSGWQAVITTFGIRKCLGTFQSPEEAHYAYLSEKRRVHEGCTI